jgi:hypothetical protein
MVLELCFKNPVMQESKSLQKFDLIYLGKFTFMRLAFSSFLKIKVTRSQSLKIGYFLESFFKGIIK